MKKLVYAYPFLSRIILAVVLGFMAIVLSGTIYNAIPVKPFFPFVGEVLLLLVTWLLFRTDGLNLRAIGMNPSARNFGYLILGLVIGVAAMLAVTWLRTLYTGEVWHVSSAIDGSGLAKSLYYILPTVMVQEIMFRGYPFTRTISKYGVVKANVIFAFLFMLVHVLDRDVLQNPAQVIMLAITIPVGHLWFATALLRSKTLLFPIGLHWGNNWAVTHLAGTTDNSQSLFYLTGQQVYQTWPPFIIMLLIFNAFFLLVTLAIWKWRLPFYSANT